MRILDTLKRSLARFQEVRQKRHAGQEIIVGSDSITTVYRDERRAVIAFADITEVAVYKVDLYTVDDLQVRMATKKNDVPLIYTFSENEKGFGEMMRSLERLPGFNRRWHEIVVQPAFARNFTIIYQRSTP